MIKNKIKNSVFIKSIFQLAVGSIIAQIITIICSPILTRIYSVKDMGIYALILSVITIFGSVINGKYDYAIVSTRDESDIPQLIHASTIFSIFFILLIGIGLQGYMFLTPQMSKSIGNWMYLTLILLFIVGIGNILNAYNNRYKEYKLISEVYVARTSVQNILLIFTGVFGLGAIGMIASQIVGNLFGIKRQKKSFDKNYTLLRNMNLKQNLLIMKKYKNFPIFSMSANLINNLSYSIINFFVSGLFGLTILGYYSLTYRILGLPLSLVSVNVSKVFFRDAAEEYKESKGYRTSLKKASTFLIPISILMCVVLMMWAPFLFRLVFGENWSVAGDYARILAPMFSVRLVVGSLVPAFIICNKQRLEMIFQILFLLSSILCFVISKKFDLGISTFLTMYSFINVIIYVLLYIIIYRLGRGEKDD